jgi:hypothetical protein
MKSPDIEIREVTCKPDQSVSILTLNQIDPFSLCVALELDGSIWRVESARGDFQIDGSSQVEVALAAFNYFQRKEKKPRGRPAKLRKSCRFFLTQTVSDKIAELSVRMGVDRSTVVSYLVLKAISSANQAIDQP